MTSLTLVLVIICGIASLPVQSVLAQPLLSDSEFSEQVGSEYEYRKRLEAEAPQWAQELVQLYKWSVKYGIGYHPLVGTFNGKKPSSTEISERMNSEFAWLVVAGHGLIATYDFQHAEQSLLGSTSRLVAGLTKSKAFWREVKIQCEQVEQLGRNLVPQGMTAKACAERLNNDLRISQLVGSNVSLFVGAGIVIQLGKKVFSKYFAGWFARRVAPMLPAAARSGWVIGGVAAAVIILPTGYLFASIEKERETAREFLSHLPEALAVTEDLRLKESVMKRQALQLEHDVLKLAIWIDQRLPKANEFESLALSQEEQNRLLGEVKILGPNYGTLLERKDRIIEKRRELESELNARSEVYNQLRFLYEKRRMGDLSELEKTNLRKAQYLVALRLVVPFIVLNH